MLVLLLQLVGSRASCARAGAALALPFFLLACTDAPPPGEPPPADDGAATGGGDAGGGGGAGAGGAATGGAGDPCPGQTSCGGACVDTASDPLHCGGCGVACAPGQACGGGVCQLTCDPPNVVCGTSCVDLLTDAGHCGACGHACQGGELCSAGSCVPDCPAGKIACGASCVDPQTSAQHCGGCGAPCGPGQACQGGSCAATGCAAGETLCAGVCVDLKSSPQHCGACANACSGNGCFNGKCTMRVFITSLQWTGNLGGLTGADTKCQDAATAAGLSGTYKAWLSDSTGTAAARLSHATVPYVKVNGTAVANSWTDLTDGSLASPINLTEFGQAPVAGTGGCFFTTPVASCTTTNGSLKDQNGHCANWTKSDNSAAGRWGDAAVATSSWTDACTPGINHCAWTGSLYCFEQ